MASVSIQVAASTDDARNINGNGTFNATVTSQQIGINASVNYWNGWRWLNVTVPQGATITSATLDLFSAGTATGTTALAKFYGELSVNPVTFANSTGGKPEGRSRTTASTSKSFTVSQWTGTGFGKDLVDVTAIVQEIVNQGSFVSGNAMVIVATDNGSSNNNYIGHSTYDSNTSRGATLVINYSSATAAPNPPTGLTATAEQENRVVLNWVDNGTAPPNNEDSYRVERSTTSGSGFSEIGSTGQDITYYIDLTASASTTYYYRVRARNSFGDSAYTSEANCTTPAANAPWSSHIEAWFFPTAAHSPVTEYSDGRVINTLKPEYLHLNSLGAIEVRDTIFGTYGYSTSNAASVKAYSNKQAITVSCGVYADLQTMLNNSTNRNQAVTDIVSYITTWGFPGVDIDFEKFSSWGATEFTNFNTFMASLKSSLNSIGKFLAVNVPAIRNATYQASYPHFTYEGLIANVDYMCIMAYDYHFDNGAGQPIAPNAYVTDIVAWTFSKIGWSNRSKLVMGMPSYSYHGTTAGFTITEETYDESVGYTGFSGATRDPNSYEMMWANGGTSYVYQDSSGMDSKRLLIENQGVQRVSVWHLGGNNWFSGTRLDIQDTSVTQVAATLTATGGTQSVNIGQNAAITQVAATLTASGGTQGVATVRNVSIAQVAAVITAQGGTQDIQDVQATSIFQVAANVVTTGGTQAIATVNKVSIAQVAATLTATGGTQAIAGTGFATVAQVAATLTTTGGTQAVTAGGVISASITQVAAVLTATGGTQGVASVQFAAVTQVAVAITASGGTQSLSTINDVAISQVAATLTVAGGTQSITSVSSVAIIQVTAAVRATGGMQGVVGSAFLATSVTQVAAVLTVTGGVPLVATSAGPPLKNLTSWSNNDVKTPTQWANNDVKLPAQWSNNDVKTPTPWTANRSL